MKALVAWIVWKVHSYLHTDAIYFQMQYIKPIVQICRYNVENVFKLLKSQDKELTFDHLEIWRQSGFEEAEKPEPELRRGTRWLQSWLRDLHSLELVSRCLKKQILISSEQQQPDKEILGSLLSIKRFWRKRGLCLVRLQCLISSSYISWDSCITTCKLSVGKWRWWGKASSLS